MFDSNWPNFQFLSSDSDSTCRNPPRAHLHMSETVSLVQKSQKNSCFLKFNPMIGLKNLFFQNCVLLFLGSTGGFQTCGGVPGEDFYMQNPNLQSEIENSWIQRRKSRSDHFLKLIKEPDHGLFLGRSRCI